MKADKEKTRENVVENYVRQKARKAARQLIDEISSRAAQDVDSRLKYLDPAPPEAGSKPVVPPSARCGMQDANEADMQQGMEALFQRYYKAGVAALNRGDASTATFYLGKCLLLPVSDELKMRQMVRHNLRLALSLRARMALE